MRVSLSLIVFTIFVGTALVPTPTEAVWNQILPVLSEQIKSLWQSNELQFLGSDCSYSQKPKVRRWQLYFYGYFSCTNYPGIRGHVRTRSRSSVMVRTIEDFLNKAKNSGAIDEAVARAWLDGFAD